MANNDEKNKINFSSPKKYEANKNYKNIKKINLFKKDNEKAPNKLNIIHKWKNENKHNHFPLKINGKKRRNFSSKMKSKPKIKESFEKVNQNKNVLENAPNKIEKVNFLISSCALNFMSNFNDNKKSNQNKELERKRKFLSEVGICYDTVDSSYGLPKKLEKNIFKYKIAKIIYTLNSNCIQSLQIIYKNRNDGSLITVENDDCIIENKKKYIIKFPDCLEIKLLGVEKEKDIGFTIQCGNEIYDIGYIQNSESNQNQKYNNQILLGIGMKACPSFGISNLNFKLSDSSKFAIQFYDGFLQLRAKLKNPVFKKKIFKNFNSFNEKQKLIVTICNLPDLLFYSVMNNLLIL